MMVSKGHYPNIALFQVCALLYLPRYMEDPQVTMSCNTKICSKTWMILDGLGYHCHYFRKPPDNIQMLLGVNHDYTNLQISVYIYIYIYDYTILGCAGAPSMTNVAE